MRVILLSVAAAGLMLILERVRPPRTTLLYDALFDAGHAPLFGLLALVCLGLSLCLVTRAGFPRVYHYLLAFGGSVAANVAAEWAQFEGPRDADLVDLLRGVAGAAAFLLFVSTYDPIVVRSWGPAAGGRRGLLRALSVLLLLAAFAASISTGWAYLRRNLAFPRLSEFQTAWEKRFLHTQYASLELQRLPQHPGRDPRDLAARVTFHRRRVSGLVIRELYPDWSGYDRLALTVYSALDGPVELRVRIDDIRHRYFRSSRYEFSFTIAPGENPLTLPIAELADGDDDDLDTTRMCHLFLFARRPAERFSVHVDHLRLERD